MTEKKKEEPKQEIAPVEVQLPAERTTSHRGIKKLDREDQMIPRIKVMQGLSPEVQEGIAKYGDLVNSLTKENYGKEVVIVPIDWSTSRIYWKERKEGGGIVCRAFDGKKGSTFGDCSNCEHKNWKADESGENIPSACTKIFNILGAIAKPEKQPELIAVSFLKTSFKFGKEWINVMNYKNVDLFNFSYKLYTDSVSNDMGTYNVLRYKDLNSATPEALYKMCAGLYERFTTNAPIVDDITEDDTPGKGSKAESKKQGQKEFDF